MSTVCAQRPTGEEKQERRQPSTLDGLCWDVHRSKDERYDFVLCLRSPLSKVDAYFPQGGQNGPVTILVRLFGRPKDVFRITVGSLDHISLTSTHFVLWGATQEGKTDVFVFDTTDNALPYLRVGNDMERFKRLCLGVACTLSPRHGRYSVATATNYGFASRSNVMDQKTGMVAFPEVDSVLN
jgi:hypothetical protein